MMHLLIHCPYTMRHEVRWYAQRLKNEFGINVSFLDREVPGTEPIGVVARIMNCRSDGWYYYRFWAQARREFGMHLWGLNSLHPILFLTNGQPSPEFEEAERYAEFVPLHDRRGDLNGIEIRERFQDLANSMGPTNQLCVWIFDHPSVDEFITQLKEHQGPFYTVATAARKTGTWALKRLEDDKSMDEQTRDLDRNHLFYWIGSSVPGSVTTQPVFTLPLRHGGQVFCWPVRAQARCREEKTGNFFRFLWRGKG